MADSPQRSLVIPRLDLGLNTRDPSTRLLPGQLARAENIVLNDGRLARPSDMGYTRTLDAVPNDHAYKFDGRTYLRAPILAAGSNASLTSADFTIEIFFRPDSVPLEFNASGAISTLLYKGAGVNKLAALSTSNTDLFFGILQTAGNVPRFYVYLGGAAINFTSISGDVEVGDLYHFALTRAGATFTGYLHKVGTPLGASIFSTVDFDLVQDTAADLLIGAVSVANAVSDIDEAQYRFKGIIQDIRIWNDDRSVSELEALDEAQIPNPASESELICHWPLTGAGTNTYFFPSTKGTAGSGAAQSPIQALEPRFATWRKSGHVLGNPFSGTSTLDLNGKFGGFSVRDAYRYRNLSVQNDAGGIEFASPFEVSVRFTPRSLVHHDTVFQYVQVTSNTWTDYEIPDDLGGGTTTTGTTPGAAAVTGQFAIEVYENGAGNFRFRAIVWHVNGGNTRATVAITANNLVAGTTYTVSAWIASGTLFIKSNTDATVSTAMVGPGLPPASTNDIPGMNKKYWMTIGRNIKRARRIITSADPNAILVETTHSRTLDGELRQVIVSAEGNDPTLLHEYNRTEIITRTNSASLGNPLTSCWPMDDTDGGIVEDVGIESNHLSFKDDSLHRWGDSILPTNTKGDWDGVFDHRYLGPTGEVRRIVGVSGGTIYNLDLTARTFARLADGFRNDNHNLISAISVVDGLVLCAGGKGWSNFHLWRDQLYDLSIRPPDGHIAVGIDDQGNKEAVLKQGDYRVGFAFYSRHTGKFSPIGQIQTVRIRSKTGTLKFGTIAELNQVPATVNFTVKAPIDFAGLATNVRVEISSWYGNTGATTSADPDWWESGPTFGINEVKPKRLALVESGVVPSFESFVDDSASVSAEELADYTNVVMSSNRVLSFVNDDTATWRVESTFIGSGSRLHLKDTAGGSQSDTILGFTDLTTTVGSGDASHGVALPTSPDDQVTHLAYFRSLNGGGSLRLAGFIQKGVTGFIAQESDEDLTGEVFDEVDGTCPPTELGIEFDGRAIYARDALQPSRLYFSKIREFWNVPPENFITVRGASPITGLSSVEGGGVVWKEESISVLTPPTNQTAPFTISTRTTGLGCLAPFSIAVKDEQLYFASELGFHIFNLASYRELSGLVEPTWRTVPTANRRAISAMYDRRNQEVIWATRDDRVFVLCLDLGTDQGGDDLGWSLRTNMNVRGFSKIQSTAEEELILLFDDYGHLYQWRSGITYGVGALIVTSLTPISGTATTVVVPKVSNATRFPDGYLGLYITLVRPDGSRESRIVTADNFASPNSTLTVATWTGASPTTSDTVLVAIPQTVAETGVFSPGGMDREHKVVDVFLRQDVQSAGEFLLSVTGDGGVLSRVTQSVRVLATERNARLPLFPAVQGREASIKIESLASSTPFGIYDLAATVELAASGRPSGYGGA